MSEQVTVSVRKNYILRHALGLTRKEKPYRNHFVTGPGSDDYDDCIALVNSGMMLRRKGNEVSGGDDIFTVTDKGKAIALKGGEE